MMAGLVPFGGVASNTYTVPMVPCSRGQARGPGGQGGRRAGSEAQACRYRRALAATALAAAATAAAAAAATTARPPPIRRHLMLRCHRQAGGSSPAPRCPSCAAKPRGPAAHQLALAQAPGHGPNSQQQPAAAAARTTGVGCGPCWGGWQYARGWTAAGGSWGRVVAAVGASPVHAGCSGALAQAAPWAAGRAGRASGRGKLALGRFVAVVGGTSNLLLQLCNARCASPGPTSLMRDAADVAFSPP